MTCWEIYHLVRWFSQRTKPPAMVRGFPSPCLIPVMVSVHSFPKGRQNEKIQYSVKKGWYVIWLWCYEISSKIISFFSVFSIYVGWLIQNIYKSWWVNHLWDEHHQLPGAPCPRLEGGWLMMTCNSLVVFGRRRYYCRRWRWRCEKDNPLATKPESLLNDALRYARYPAFACEKTTMANSHPRFSNFHQTLILPDLTSFRDARPDPAPICESLWRSDWSLGVFCVGFCIIFRHKCSLAIKLLS